MILNKVAQGRVQRTMSARAVDANETTTKSKVWCQRWDRKCDAPFTDYTPPVNARLIP
jgi:hypothetical protein